MAKKGDKGPAVVAIQQLLGLTADGNFGPQTVQAVKAFQSAHGLTADGVVGPQTLAALQAQAPVPATAPTPAPDPTLSPSYAPYTPPPFNPDFDPTAPYAPSPSDVPYKGPSGASGPTSQTPQPSHPASSTSRLVIVDTYDSIFQTWAKNDIPVPYLRSLAYFESQLNPRCINGSAMGLMQILSGATLADFNKDNNKSIKPSQLFDPNVNVRVGCWLIRKIVKEYTKYIPQVVPAADWNDPRFIQLLTLGWTAGWTAKSGVPFVVGKMLASGIAPSKIGLDEVIQTAGVLKPNSNVYSRPKPGPYMSDPYLKGWVNKVSAKYFEETQGPGSFDPDSPGNSKSETEQVVMALASVAALGTVGYLIHSAVSRGQTGARRT